MWPLALMVLGSLSYILALVLGSLYYILALALSPQTFIMVLAVGSMAFNKVPEMSLAASMWSLASYKVLRWALTLNLALADLWYHSLGSLRGLEEEIMGKKTGHPAMWR